jgi:hypothetical protein
MSVIVKGKRHPFGQLISETFSLFFKHYPALFQMLVALIVVDYSTYLLHLFYPNILDLRIIWWPMPAFYIPSLSWEGLLYVLNLLVYISIGQFVSMLAASFYYNKVCNTKESKGCPCWDLLYRLPGFVLISVVCFLASAAVFGVCYVLLFLFGKFIPWLWLRAGLTFLTVLASYVAGIYITVNLSLANMIYLFDRVFLRSFRSSFSLVCGNFWHVFSVLAFSLGLVMFLNFLFLPYCAFFFVKIMHFSLSFAGIHSAYAMHWDGFLGYFLQSFSRICLVSPLFAIFVVTLYLNLRETKKDTYLTD